MRHFILFSVSVLLFSCSPDRDNELDNQLYAEIDRVSNGLGVGYFQLPEDTDLNAIPQDPLNPLTPEKVLLGKFLFHESALGVEPLKPFAIGTYSCASCHFASAGFQACKPQGIGEGGMGFGANGESRARNVLYTSEELDVQPIRSPSAMHIAWQPNVLWNGQFGATFMNAGTESEWTLNTPKETNYLGFEGTETQAIAGLKVHRMNLNKEWAEFYGYVEMFEAAFPGIPESELYTRKYAGLAIAAYERTLLANRAPFQRWLRGQHDAMTDSEKRGAIVFFNQGNCVACHTGPALNSMAFHALGMNDLYLEGSAFNVHAGNGENLGRGGFTKKPEDMYKFKVPQLYNLKDSPQFGHGASFKSIREVIDYKNKGIKQNSTVPDGQLADEFVPLLLTEEQIDDLTTFITFGLRDPFLKRYQPDNLLSGNCIPNNDPKSKSDLGCE